MCAELPREDTTGIIRRFVAGQDDAIGQYCARHQVEMVRAAAMLIRCLGIAEVELEGQEAVNIALYELFQARDRGTLAAIKNSDEFRAVCLTFVKRVILKVKKRCDAIKRGGGVSGAGEHERQADGDIDARGTNRHFRRIEAALDQLYCDVDPAEDVVLANEELKEFLAVLGDPTLQEILKMRLRKCTIDEIADHLGLVPRTIKRKRAMIRMAYDEYRLTHQ